jgi:hypothetical protein
VGKVDMKSIGTLIDELVTIRLKMFVNGMDFDTPDPGLKLHQVERFRMVDRLVRVNMKIFFLLEEANKQAEEGDLLGVGESYGAAQRLNSRRTALIAAIDNRFGEADIAQTEKTF